MHLPIKFSRLDPPYVLLTNLILMMSSFRHTLPFLCKYVSYHTYNIKEFWNSIKRYGLKQNILKNQYTYILSLTPMGWGSIWASAARTLWWRHHEVRDIIIKVQRNWSFCLALAFFFFKYFGSMFKRSGALMILTVKD